MEQKFAVGEISNLVIHYSHLCPRFGLPICEVLVVHNAQRGAECSYLPPRGNMVGDTRHPSRHSVWRRSFRHLF